VGSESKTKKPGGTLSYKDSYTDAVASKWESKGGYDAYEKAAKAWNKKKYGTTEPTSKAKAGGITKKELATKHADKPKFTESLTINGKKTDVKDLGPKYTSYGVMAPTDNAANTSLGKTIGAANSSESLLGGVQTRREKRKIARHELSQKLDPRQNERKRSREQRRNARKTGSKFGKPSSTPELNTGAGTYQGGPVKKKKTGGGEFWGKSGPIK